MKIILATHNDNKLREIRKIFEATNIEFVSLKELNFKEEIEETGKTFEENAYIKAKYISDIYNLPTLADDSGLEIEALDGFPGVYSARYANGNFHLAMTNILEELKDEKNRKADFNCSICYIDENKEKHMFVGKCYGEIGTCIKGDDGFGYDPIFNVGGRSFAELSLDEKNKISHRGLALKRFYDYIKKL